MIDTIKEFGRDKATKAIYHTDSHPGTHDEGGYNLAS